MNKEIVHGSSPDSIPSSYSEMAASGETFLAQKGVLNNFRVRPQILNEHVESSRTSQGVVTSSNIVGQFFKASQNNINGLNLTLESAVQESFDDFESYDDSAALQVQWEATNADEKASLEESIVYEGTKSMKLPGDADVDDEWSRDFVAADFTGYTGQFHMYASKKYRDASLRVFVKDSSANTSSSTIVQTQTNEWQSYVVDINSLTADDATPADLTDIVRIGFRLENEKRDAVFYIDEMISVPGPGFVDIKLWNMGASLPADGSAIDDGTQYTKLGDLGITGIQAAAVRLELLGGKRMYHIDQFVAGTSLEIPTNEVLTVGNYYAITVNYVDTDVTVYGTNPAFSTSYYTNGYAFTAASESAALSKTGEYNDIQFMVFSTQDVYLVDFGFVLDETPGGDASVSIYAEDSSMSIQTVIVSNVIASKATGIDFVVKQRPAFMEKGSKFEANYNDDYSDSVTRATLGIRYAFIPPIVNG